MEMLHRTSAFVLMTSVAFATVAACTHIGQDDPPKIIGLQNWTDEDSWRWRNGSQGSRLIPERWLYALEAPSSRTRFIDPAFFDRFNYPRLRGEELPIGFARDYQDDDDLPKTKLRWFSGQRSNEVWIGLNCAACHTARINVNGQDRLIEGGPTMADFQGFTGSLLEAMRQARSQPDRWERFAAAVLAPRGKGDRSRDTAENRARLRSSVDSWLKEQGELERLNAGATPYGYGRLDAVGHILNKVAYLNKADGQEGGPPDAPVSYPHIWNAPQHDKLQWNGIVPNDKIVLRDRDVDTGALVRNVSEVIGVFADVEVRSGAGFKGYASSVDTRNLMAMELQLARLASPAWADFLGATDAARAKQGRRLFMRDCVGCHAPLAREDLKSPIQAVMSPIFEPGGVGTDKWMACNAVTYRALGGELGGNLTGVIKPLSKERQPDGTTKLTFLGVSEPTHRYLGNQAIGTILGRKVTTILTALQTWFGTTPKIKVPPRPPGEFVVFQQKGKQEREKECRALEAGDTEASKLVAYKGRPLNGIWATGPYLHNGSVRTLYQLLLPPEQREPSFHVGTSEFDAAEVGFKSVAGPRTSEFRASDDAANDGNSNRGHFYRDYSEPERWALVEYMKTL